MKCVVIMEQGTNIGLSLGWGFYVAVLGGGFTKETRWVLGVSVWVY